MGVLLFLKVEKPKATKKEEPAKVRGVNSEVRSWIFQFAASFYCREKKSVGQNACTWNVVLM